jgi:hypothetical protein
MIVYKTMIHTRKAASTLTTQVRIPRAALRLAELGADKSVRSLDAIGARQVLGEIVRGELGRNRRNRVQTQRGADVVFDRLEGRSNAKCVARARTGNPIVINKQESMTSDGPTLSGTPPHDR